MLLHTAEELFNCPTAYFAAQMMLEVSQDCQKKRRSSEAEGDRLTSVLENCVVRIAGPRRSGHTLAAWATTQRRSDGVIYLTTTLKIPAEFRAGRSRAKYARTLSYFRTHPDSIRGIDAELIIVDWASGLGPGDLEWIIRHTIECTCMHERRYYLLLG